MAANEPTTEGRAGLPRSELVLSFALLGLLVVFLIPLQPIILDGLLAFNLSITILLLLVTIGVKQAMDFSTFPSLLLLLTLVRLGLNVATTRLILLEGNAGDVVQAFGQFVVGGNLVVGLVIFLILVVIQFVVITRGASRVSEVAARFTLDSMPGKQTAIDAELNAGIISDVQAKKQRSELMRESEFYGTMDGASKFVRGDAVAGLIITAINLIGGIIIGVLKGMPISDAVKTYSILTIGDGLITQIPALIIATSAGILVTKSSSESSIGQEISSQFGRKAGTVQLASFVIMGLALVPGLPKLPFIALGIGTFVLARRLRQAMQAKEAREAEKTARDTKKAEPAVPVKSPQEQHVESFLQVDRISIDLGVRLIPLVDSKDGPGLIEQIGFIRRDIGRTSGIWVPNVRLQDTFTIDPEAYRILIEGREVARYEVKFGMWMALDVGLATGAIDGIPTREPAYDFPAFWIPDSMRQRAEMAGYRVIDVKEVILNHLVKVIHKHAHELLSRDDFKLLIDKVKETSPALVDELIPGILPMATVHRVVTLLLEEQVPITNMVRILESLAINGLGVKTPPELVEMIRPDLGRSIAERFRDEFGVVHAIAILPEVEEELRNMFGIGLRGNPAKPNLGLVQALIDRLKVEAENEKNRGREACLLTTAPLRRALRTLLMKQIPDLSVITREEMPNDIRLAYAAGISIDSLQVR